MDETMNTTGTNEVTTEVAETGLTQNIGVEEETSSGPSKSFVALAVGGIAGAAIMLGMAIRRHKKKKAKAIDQDEFDDFDETEESEQIIDVEAEEKPVEEGNKSEEKPTNKK